MGGSGQEQMGVNRSWMGAGESGWEWVGARLVQPVIKATTKTCY